jgi:hypothetical protein
MRIDWKKRALEAEDRARKAEAYAVAYGNASGRCAAGYWQQQGLICHHCQHDNSSGEQCPKAPCTPRDVKRGIDDARPIEARNNDTHSRLF